MSFRHFVPMKPPRGVSSCFAAVKGIQDQFQVVCPLRLTLALAGTNGSSPTYRPFMRTYIPPPVTRAIGASRAACRGEFRRNPRSHSCPSRVVVGVENRKRGLQFLKGSLCLHVCEALSLLAQPLTCPPPLAPPLPPFQAIKEAHAQLLGWIGTHVHANSGNWEVGRWVRQPKRRCC